MRRVGRLLETWRTNWADDPAARGAAKMAAGATLVMEGLFGKHARVRGESGGHFVVLFLILFGAIFFGVGFFIKPTPFDDEIAIQGTIISSASHMNRDSDGHSQRMYRAVYGYEVNGKPYSFHSSMSSSSVPKIGKEVQIAYSASKPHNARRTDGMDGRFHLIFQGIGGVVALLGLYQVMICMLLVGAGLALFSSGRKDRMSSGTTDGFFKDLFSLVRAERNNREVAFAGGVGGTSLPPAGWMMDPENSGQMRWWDGTAWTDMFQPVQSEQAVVVKQPDLGELTDTDGW